MRTLGEKSTAAVFLVQHFRHAERDAVCFASLENFCSWTVFFCSLPHELSKYAKLIARVQYRDFFFHNWWRRSSCMLPASSIFLSSIAFFFLCGSLCFQLPLFYCVPECCSVLFSSVYWFCFMPDEITALWTVIMSAAFSTFLTLGISARLVSEGILPLSYSCDSWKSSLCMPARKAQNGA